MKRFLSNLLLAFAFFLVLLAAVEFLYVPNIPNHYKTKYDYLDSHTDSIRTLLMGPSYSENGINPTIIGDDCFDLAISARWIYYDLQLLKDFVPRMPQLQTVLFTMGYTMPFAWSHNYTYRNTVLARDNDFYYMRYMNCRYDRFPDNFKHYFGLRIGLSELALKGEAHNPKAEAIKTGFYPTPGQHADWKEYLNISPDIIHNPYVEQELAEYTDYLTQMAQICHDHGVRLIVVTPPCHDCYRTVPEGIDRLHQIITDVQTHYPVEYYDYLQDPQFRADSLYFNCSHLNHTGATLFATRLKSDFHL